MLCLLMIDNKTTVPLFWFHPPPLFFLVGEAMLLQFYETWQLYVLSRVTSWFAADHRGLVKSLHSQENANYSKAETSDFHIIFEKRCDLNGDYPKFQRTFYKVLENKTFPKISSVKTHNFLALHIQFDD
jgi:hypothetical protein